MKTRMVLLILTLILLVGCVPNFRDSPTLEYQTTIIVNENLKYILSTDTPLTLNKDGSISVYNWVYKVHHFYYDGIDFPYIKLSEPIFLQFCNYLSIEYSIKKQYIRTYPEETE